jgi:hypothetical protein
MYQCPHCQRLILSNTVKNNSWEFYKLEDVSV